MFAQYGLFVNPKILQMEGKLTKPFDYALDVTKLIIGLCTGLITIVLTFHESIFNCNNSFVFISLIFLLISILMGLWTTLALTGSVAELNKANESNTHSGINSWSIRLPSMLQISLFVLALIFFVVHIAVNHMF